MRTPRRTQLILAAVAVAAGAAVGGVRETTSTGVEAVARGDVLGEIASKRSSATPAAGRPQRNPEVAPARFGGRVIRTRTVRPRYVPGRILVRFRDSAGPATVQAAIARADGDLARTIRPLDVGVVEVDPERAPEAIAALKASPAVEYVEREVVLEALAPIRPDDMLWESQWGLKLVEADQAWATTKGSSGVVVAVLDTGVDASHPDLSGALVPGHDFVNGDADAADDHGHGTAVAGVVAARGDNGEGPAGVCWSCTILPVKVLGADGSGTSSAVAAGVVWAVDRGARVLNLSLGAPTTTQALTDAVVYAASKGAVLVAAAGNNGSTTPFYPAAYPQVISVGGTTAADALYDWTNRGSWVDVGAPGCNPAPAPAAAYVNFCGTSSAAPVVAGLAALAASAQPSATPGEIENAITSTALAVGAGTEIRYGRVRAARMLAALGVPATPAARPAAPPVRTVKATFRGELPHWTRTRRFVRATAQGRVTLYLTARTNRLVRLSIRNARGQVVSRIEGRAPLRVVRRLGAGRYSFVVSSPVRTHFTLVAFYPVKR